MRLLLNMPGMIRVHNEGNLYPLHPPKFFKEALLQYRKFGCRQLPFPALRFFWDFPIKETRFIGGISKGGYPDLIVRLAITSRAKGKTKAGAWICENSSSLPTSSSFLTEK